MKILQLSDTHNRHALLANFPVADIVVHCGDFTDMGTETEVLDFLNWFIALPFQHKIFVTGNHDLCLWDAEAIEDLPENVHFLQDRSCEIGGVKFFGLGYNHQEEVIPKGVDVLVTHEPPMMILDESNGKHWGNLPLRNRVMEVKPRYHLFGHAHESYGVLQQDGIVFANSALLDDYYQQHHLPHLFEV
jgi:ser/thr phosphatase family protein